MVIKREIKIPLSLGPLKTRLLISNTLPLLSGRTPHTYQTPLRFKIQSPVIFSRC